MSSKINKPSSEGIERDVSSREAVDRIIRSQAFLAPESSLLDTGTPFVDKLNTAKVEGDPADMLPVDMAEDDRIESEGAPPSQSPSSQLDSEEYWNEAETALQCYGVDTTAPSVDSSAVEDSMIESVDGADLEGCNWAGQDRDRAKEKPRDVEALNPDGTVVRRKPLQ